MNSVAFEKNNSFNKCFDQEELIENKSVFLKNLYYFCDDCKIYFCSNCITLKELSVKTKAHIHPLSIIQKDNGWACNGMTLPDKFKSDFSYFNQTHGKTRFNCIKSCDFDLCERCVYYNTEESQN